MPDLRGRIAGSLERFLYVSQMGYAPADYADKLLKRAYIAAALTAFLLAFTLYLLLSGDAVLLLLLPMNPLPLLTAAVFAPWGYVAFSYLRPRLRALRISRGLSRELPYACAYATSYVAAGLPPRRALMMLAEKSRLLPYTSRELQRVEKLRQLFGLDDLEALERDAKLHTSREWRDFVLSVVAAERGGGDVLAVFRDMLRGHFAELRAFYERLSRKMSMVAEAVVVLFAVMPLLMYVLVSVSATPEAMESARLFTFVLQPALSVAMLFGIDAMYPREPFNLYRKSYLRTALYVPVGVAVALSLLFGLITVDVPYVLAWSVGLGLLAFTGMAMVDFERERIVQASVLNALPAFTRDLAEEVKKGKSPLQAIAYLSEARSYNRWFDRLLRYVSNSLLTGRRLKKVVEELAPKLPWRVALIFDILSDAEDIGARREVFEEVASITRQVNAIVSSARKALNVYKFIGAFAAVLSIGMSTYVLRSVVVPISRIAYESGAWEMIGLITPEQVPQLADTVYVGTVISAFILGLLSGKMSENHVGAGFKWSFTFLLLALSTILFSAVV